MKINKILSCVFLTLIVACQPEPPYKDIDGHWIIDHGFFENQCQVSATFTSGYMILTFLSLVEDACQPELYGISNNALAIEIDYRRDYLNNFGAIAIDMALSNSQFAIEGDVTLTETAEGMRGAVTEVYHPDGFLDLLLQADYKLTRVPEQWLDLIKGSWGTSCDQIYFEGSADDVCEALTFLDNVNLRLFNAEPEQLASSMNMVSIAPTNDSPSLDTTYALRKVEVIEGGFTLDMVLFGVDYEEGIPIRISVIDDAMTVDLSPNNENTTAQLELFRLAD